MFPENFSNKIQHYPKYFQQKRGYCDREETIVKSPKIFPELKYLNGVEIREPDEIIGLKSRPEGPSRFSYNMELMNNLYNSQLYPDEFFADVDIVTTVSSLRSLICQWLKNERGSHYAKIPHFCQIFKGKLYFHTISDYTSPLGKSVNMIHKYRITDTKMSWSEFLREWHFGISKLRLPNGIVIAYTYRFDAIHNNKPIDVKLRTKNDDFIFIGLLLTGKKDWIYRRNIDSNISTFCATVDYLDLWKDLSNDSKYILRLLFDNDLPDFFEDLLSKSEKSDGVHQLSNVFHKFLLTRIYGKCPLIC